MGTQSILLCCGVQKSVVKKCLHSLPAQAQSYHAVHVTHGLCSEGRFAALQAGEPLTISYIDLELPRSARQLELKSNFFFDCKCTR